MSLARRFFVTVATAAMLAACAGTTAAPEPAPAPEPTAPSTDKGASSPARADVAPRNGLEVVGAMRRAHPAGSLKSMAFTVTISEPRADTTIERSASGIVGLPGRYRLVQQPSSRRSGIVRDRERLAVFEGGKRVGFSSRVDVAQLLAYDVFAQRIDSTIQWLDIARVRLGIARRDRWDGRDVWVVGAAEGDTTSTQFWVDEDRWRVLRVIQRDPRRPNDLLDVRYREFDSVMRVPVPRQIDIYRNGRHTQTQRVTDIVANPKLPSRAFDVLRWRDVKPSS
jgi:hypothetical protein